MRWITAATLLGLQEKIIFIVKLTSVKTLTCFYYKFRFLFKIRALFSKVLILIQGRNLIHIQICENLVQVLKDFEDIFFSTRGLALTIKNKLKESCFPKISSPRKLYFALHNNLQKELNSMFKAGIICKFESQHNR